MEEYTPTLTRKTLTEREIKQLGRPTIRVETEEDPLNTTYLDGDLETNIKTVCGKIQSLFEHPGRARVSFAISSAAHPNRRTSPNLANPPAFTPLTATDYDLRECSDEFVNELWGAAALLCEYFTKFYAHDDPVNQGIWFRMINMWQRTATDLPHFRSPMPWPKCSHADVFNQHYKDVIKYLNILVSINGVEQDLAGEPVIYHEESRFRVPRAFVGFLPGLKPWEQFLIDQSPGFRVPREHLEYPTPRIEMEGGAMTEQFIPMGGLAIIDSMIQRMRKLAVEFAEGIENAPGPDASAGEKAEAKFRAEKFLAGFEADVNSAPLDKPFYSTSISGRKTLFQPVAVPKGHFDAPTRWPHLSDPSGMSENPELFMLDEYAGQYIEGEAPFEHPLGNDKFWLMSVQEAKDKEEEEEEEQGEGEASGEGEGEGKGKEKAKEQEEEEKGKGKAKQEEEITAENGGYDGMGSLSGNPDLDRRMKAIFEDMWDEFDEVEEGPYTNEFGEDEWGEF